MLLVLLQKLDYFWKRKALTFVVINNKKKPTQNIPELFALAVRK